MCPDRLLLVLRQRPPGRLVLCGISQYLSLRARLPGSGGVDRLWPQCWPWGHHRRPRQGNSLSPYGSLLISGQRAPCSLVLRSVTQDLRLSPRLASLRGVGRRWRWPGPGNRLGSYSLLLIRREWSPCGLVLRGVTQHLRLSTCLARPRGVGSGWRRPGLGSQCLLLVRCQRPSSADVLLRVGKHLSLSPRLACLCCIGHSRRPRRCRACCRWHAGQGLHLIRSQRSASGDVLLRVG